MSLYLSRGGENAELSPAELKAALGEALAKLGVQRRVLAVPPDITRLHSRAGELTRHAFKFYGDALQAILPAVGTHSGMTPAQLTRMFGDVPHELFRVHNWRKDVVSLGEVPGEFVHEQSEHKLDFSWPAEVNRLVAEGDFDLVLSLGQVVPHEVIGMANFNKNILVGTGGPLSIGRSHYLGAVYGMERIMGRADNPVRRVLNYAAEHFLRRIPIVYVLTVIGNNAAGETVVRGLFIGDDMECFNLAAALSLKVNFQMMDRPIQKAVVYLNDTEYKSTWLGNKAIYRTRMALADGAELIVLAPGVKEFGEDPEIDRLIRKYGYRGTPTAMEAVQNDPDLAANLGAAAHLIHGSSEGRFAITYCPGGLSREEIEGVGYGYADLTTSISRYDPARLRDGYNTVKGEEIFYVSNPALGLWSVKERFQTEPSAADK
ncbi:MAG TPA: lactate racemase domain-containing protein [Candidatus Angelobacter sp.]|jgi:nickel-dependent lactate racemase|nr:lactate racemase domain-containing protein [Candidatus Angelobacter sp.]